MYGDVCVACQGDSFWAKLITGSIIGLLFFTFSWLLVWWIDSDSDALERGLEDGEGAVTDAAHRRVADLEISRRTGLTLSLIHI